MIGEPKTGPRILRGIDPVRLGQSDVESSKCSASLLVTVVLMVHPLLLFTGFHAIPFLSNGQREKRITFIAEQGDIWYNSKE
jgi:hypothetical protein